MTARTEPAGPGLVVAAAVFRGGRLLAAQRSYPPALRGQWELPGGKVEPGEEPVAGLARELREELGLAIRIGAELRPPGADERPGWPILGGRRMRVWLAAPLGEATPGDDHLAVRWVGPRDWQELAWLAPNVPIVAAAFAQRPPADG